MQILGDLTRGGMGLGYPILRAMEQTNALHKVYTGQEAIFRHLMDGKHKVGSRHYVGLAFDLRTWVLAGGLGESRVPEFVQDLKAALGEHYDVVSEKTHVHVEFDPKFTSIG